MQKAEQKGRFNRHCAGVCSEASPRPSSRLTGMLTLGKGENTVSVCLATAPWPDAWPPSQSPRENFRCGQGGSRMVPACPPWSRRTHQDPARDPAADRPDSPLRTPLLLKLEGPSLQTVAAFWGPHPPLLPLSSDGDRGPLEGGRPIWKMRQDKSGRMGGRAPGHLLSSGLHS